MNIELTDYEKCKEIAKLALTEANKAILGLDSNSKFLIYPIFEIQINEFTFDLRDF